MAKLTLIQKGLPLDSYFLNCADGSKMQLQRGEEFEVSTETALQFLGSSAFKVEISQLEASKLEDYQLENVVRKNSSNLASINAIKSSIAPPLKKKTIVEKVKKTVTPKTKKKVEEIKLEIEETSNEETVLEESSDEAVLANESE